MSWLGLREAQGAEALPFHRLLQYHGRMRVSALPVTYEYEVEIGPGETLRLPEELTSQFTEGTWILSVRAKDNDADEVIRDYSALLAAYCEEDEGLYDDVPAG